MEEHSDGVVGGGSRVGEIAGGSGDSQLDLGNGSWQRADVELAFGVIIGLMFRLFANYAAIQFGTIFTAPVVVPGPVVA